MKTIVTVGKNKGKEFIGSYGFENCTVEQKMNDRSGKEVIIIQYADGKLSGALTKKSTIDETLHDWLWQMRQNGYEEEQIQLAVDKVKKFF